MKKVRFTYHAVHKSLYLYGFGKRDLEDILRRSVQILPPRWVKKRNRKAYGKVKRLYFYSAADRMNFTVIAKRRYYLVVTVFEKEQIHARQVEPTRRLHV